MKAASRYEALLNAIPMPVFIVDADVRIQDLNVAAVALLNASKGEVLNERGGDILHCLHSFDTVKGCGYSSACTDCVIRNSVINCSGGEAVSRKRTQVALEMAGALTKLDFLITVSALPEADDPQFLLIIEDITELSLLKDLIPICMHCHKVRDDDHYWQSLEEYFDKYAVQISHSICDFCLEKFYPEYFLQK